jgi:hypothetical protein
MLLVLLFPWLNKMKETSVQQIYPSMHIKHTDHPCVHDECLNHQVAPLETFANATETE